MHVDEGNGPIVTLLKSDDFSRSAESPARLPYRVDHLRRQGFRLAWSDDHLHRRARRVLRRIERRTPLFLQALTSRSLRRDAVGTVAFFESEGHGLALWRRITGRRRGRLVIIACWLADLARSGGPRRRRVYRWLYKGVDDVVVFSHNQVGTLADLLAIPRERIHVVRFGVDLDELAEVPTDDGGRVVAVGRDLSRDWMTLCAAARGSDWKVDLVTRPSQLDGIEVPPEVTVHGRLPRVDYLTMLADASVVVIPTDVRDYPAGQTVLLEACAMGKPCVMTDTPGIHDYVTANETAVLVPPHDPVALRNAVDGLLEDPECRRRIGESARSRENDAGGAERMWASIAHLLDPPAAR